MNDITIYEFSQLLHFNYQNIFGYIHVIINNELFFFAKSNMIFLKTSRRFYIYYMYKWFDWYNILANIHIIILYILFIYIYQCDNTLISIFCYIHIEIQLIGRTLVAPHIFVCWSIHCILLNSWIINFHWFFSFFNSCHHNFKF